MVFVTNDADVAGRFLREGIFFDQGEDVGGAAQQMFADREDPAVLRGMAEGGEPELPVEARLVRGDPRRRASRIRATA